MLGRVIPIRNAAFASKTPYDEDLHDGPPMIGNGLDDAQCPHTLDAQRGRRISENLLYVRGHPEGDLASIKIFLDIYDMLKSYAIGENSASPKIYFIFQNGSPGQATMLRNVYQSCV